ncbi:MAG: 2-phospho-L-lactate guanylyltransferase [Acidimicrobiia bacterium]|nr:2-phospho-L-lactate guanylyltransferase [Acidimicrobiia bacterium]
MRTSHTAFLVPLKRFDAAKERLGDELGAEDRAELMRSLAGGVLVAAEGLPRWVVCDHRSVAEFALRRGAQVIWRDGGLNQAVQAASDQLGREGFTRVIVCHGDLARPGSFSDFVPVDGGAAIAPDRHGEGSNVVSVPIAAGFRFAYGPGSLGRHIDEAKRCGLSVSMIDSLELDIDTPQDLELYRRHILPAATQ